jgi:hypothetical protein
MYAWTEAVKTGTRFPHKNAFKVAMPRTTSDECRKSTTDIFKGVCFYMHTARTEQGKASKPHVQGIISLLYDSITITKLLPLSSRCGIPMSAKHFDLVKAGGKWIDELRIFHLALVDPICHSFFGIEHTL